MTGIDLRGLTPAKPKRLDTVQCRCGDSPELRVLHPLAYADRTHGQLYTVVCGCGRATPFWPHAMHAVRCFVMREQTIVAELTEPTDQPWKEVRQ